MQTKVTLQMNGCNKEFDSTEQATAYLLRYNRAVENQKEFVKEELSRNGFITRNTALSFFITRLSAIISVLKEEGMEISGEGGENGIDYIYSVIPKKIIKNLFGDDIYE